MSTLTNPTANHASRIIEKHVRVLGNLTARNIFTENEWKAYTPTCASGGTFATSATIVARWRLQGSTLHVTFSYSDSAGTGAASSGAYIVSLPSGVVLATARQNLACGSAIITEATGSTVLLGVCVAQASTPGFTLQVGTELVAPVPWGNSAPAGTRLTTAASKIVNASLIIEIDPTSPLLLAQNT